MLSSCSQNLMFGFVCAEGLGLERVSKLRYASCEKPWIVQGRRLLGSASSGCFSETLVFIVMLSRTNLKTQNPEAPAIFKEAPILHAHLASSTTACSMKSQGQISNHLNPKPGWCMNTSLIRCKQVLHTTCLKVVSRRHLESETDASARQGQDLPSLAHARGASPGLSQRFFLGVWGSQDPDLGQIG